MKSTVLSVAALVGLASTVVQAGQSLDVTHEPIKGLWTADGRPSHPNFLASRWQTSSMPLNFRKRDSSDSKRLGGKLGRLLDKLDNVGQDKKSGLLKILNNYGKEVTSWIENGKLFDASLGIVINKATDNSADNEWLVNVGFGTLPQPLKMVFDTGSSDTWVYSPACCYANNHTFFNPSRSFTYRNRTVVNGEAQAAPKGTPGQDWSYYYGSNTGVYGYVGLDAFTFGLPLLRVDNLPVALATELDGSRASRGMEGIIGLSTGSGTYTDGGWTTPFEAMSSRGLIRQTYLTATLIKADRNTGNGGGGRYTFGEIDNYKLKGGITWTRALSPYLWAGYFDSMSFGGTTLATAPGTDDAPIRFMIDTGSAVFYLPPAFTAQINSKIVGSYKTDDTSVAFPYLVPCNTGLKQYEKQAKNPSFNLKINGTDFTVPKEDYVFYANEPVPASAAGGKTGMCYSAFQDGPDQISIIGLSFIKNNVVVFDQGGKDLSARRIGFGKRTDVDYS